MAALVKLDGLVYSLKFSEDLLVVDYGCKSVCITGPEVTTLSDTEPEEAVRTLIREGLI